MLVAGSKLYSTRASYIACSKVPDDDHDVTVTARVIMIMITFLPVRRRAESRRDAQSVLPFKASRVTVCVTLRRRLCGPGAGPGPGISGCRRGRGGLRPWLG